MRPDDYAAAASSDSRCERSLRGEFRFALSFFADGGAPPHPPPRIRRQRTLFAAIVFSRVATPHQSSIEGWGASARLRPELRHLEWSAPPPTRSALRASAQHFDGTRYHGVNVHNVWYRGTVEFRWFEAALHTGKVKAYIQLVLAVATKALNGRAASSRKRRLDPRSARYDFRVFLLHLELIGDPKEKAGALLASLIDHGPAEYVEAEPAAPITVSAAVWQGLEAVKDSGATNMLDRPAVIKIAEILGFRETARLIEAHHGQYSEGLFKGFVVDTQEGKL